MPESSTRLILTTDQKHGGRTHTCGELRPDQIGMSVILKGWVDTQRNLGGLVFADLRDRYGLTQIVFAEEVSAESYAIAESLRGEDVISIAGVVRERESKNHDLPSGMIEVYVTEIEVLNTAEPLPFMVSAHEERQQNTGDDLRLKYRYLDLRRPALQRNMILRHKLYQATRRYMDTQSFVEVETPVLMKSTPEGARDYLVPSRVHPGQFYALPQSPQTYKQLLMIAGLDRYFQIVKCFRDEDLRADRQPEFTQIDVEMTFATEELIYEMTEGLIAAIWKDTRGIEIPTPFPRMPYADAIRRFGSDKPDLRFGMELVDLSSALQGSGFRVFESTFESGGAVVAIRVEGQGDIGRGKLDKITKDIVQKRIGAPGLFSIKLPADGSDFAASVKEEALPRPFVQHVIDATGAQAGELVLMLAGPQPKVFEQMGSLRLHMAEDIGLIPAGNDGPWEFLWVTDFPLFEFDEENARFYAMHHPFTSPKPDDLPILESDPGAARARAYDLVLNGSEMGGGSIRIHQREVQSQMFRHLGIGEAEAEERFGFLLNAFRYGAPPHGGIALGLDRLVMMLSGASSLRDVIAFPKTQAATELMSNSPDFVDADQLDTLHIRTVLPDAAMS